jgi:hypothetical protein
MAANIGTSPARFNHRDTRVTEEHYNLSAGLGAGEEYALITRSYREPSQ